MQHKINKITHQELQYVFGYSAACAQQKIKAIRLSLGKSRKKILTVFEFCKAEDMELKEFDELAKRANEKI